MLVERSHLDMCNDKSGVELRPMFLRFRLRYVRDMFHYKLCLCCGCALLNLLAEEVYVVLGAETKNTLIENISTYGKNKTNILSISFVLFPFMDNTTNKLCVRC